MIALEQNIKDIGELQSLTNSIDVVQDIVMSLCGKLIGEGCYRSVYQYNLHDDYVIKVEWGNQRCNIVEYMLWNEIQYLSGDYEWIKNWFAPVDWISPNGHILVMKKTEPRPDKKRPEKIPKFMWDVKNSNFGWIGNKFVCHDYGQFYNFISYSKRMVKAYWN